MKRQRKLEGEVVCEGPHTMAVTPVNGSAPSQSQVMLHAMDAKAELRQAEPHNFPIFCVVNGIFASKVQRLGMKGGSREPVRACADACDSTHN